MSDPFDGWKLQPWHRAHGESGKAHAAARVYFELGPDERSCAEVARRLSKSRQLIERWSRKHGWVERARAYDQFLSDEDLKANLRERRAMQKRHAQAAQVGLAIAVRKLVTLQNEIGNNLAAGRMSISEATRLLDVCTKLE